MNMFSIIKSRSDQIFDFIDNSESHELYQTAKYSVHVLLKTFFTGITVEFLGNLQKPNIDEQNKAYKIKLYSLMFCLPQVNFLKTK